MTTRVRRAAGLALSAAWGAAQRLPVESSLLRLLPAALLVLAVAWRLRPPGALERPALAPLATGLGAGALMVAATYPAFALLASLAPTLSAATAALYASARLAHPVPELAALVLIVAAEEVLWRGLLPHALLPELGAVGAGGLSSAVYALAQYGQGSTLLAGVAFGCGLFWALLRARTGSVWASFACHLVWTLAVVVVRPLV